jgi:UDP-GlcNAc:undecaprenyl-phosphate GlcNAc-1-phosphate transferase
VLGYALLFGLAAGSTFVLTFPVRRLAIRFGLVQKPDDLRVHNSPTPTAGGASMFLAFLLCMAVAARVPHFDDAFAGSSLPLGIVLGAAVMFGVGLLDDLREVSPPAKMAGYVLAGSVLSFFAVAIFFFRVPFGPIIVISPDLQPLLTVIWVAGMATAVNWIDGLDGLAAGIVAIAAGAFFLYASRLEELGLITQEKSIAALVAVIVVGICIGFLPHNFHPARVFMGETGASLLGILMASATMVVGGGTAAEFSGQTFFFFAPIVIPFVILGVPIADTAFAIVRRSLRRSSPAMRDVGHLHYRLLQLGHGHRRAVLILWAWTAILSALVLFPTYTGEGDAAIPIAVAALGVLLYTVFHPGLRRTAPEGLGEVIVLDEAARARKTS